MSRYGEPGPGQPYQPAEPYEPPYPHPPYPNSPYEPAPNSPYEQEPNSPYEQEPSSPYEPYQGPPGPPYEDPAYPEPPYQDPRYQDPGHPDPRYQDPRYQDPPDGAYEPPSDPWLRHNDSWRDEVTAPHIPAEFTLPPAGAGAHRVAGEPAGGPDDRGVPPRRRTNLLLFASVGLLVLVVAAAVGYALYLLSGEDPGQVAQPGPVPTGSPGASPEPPLDNLGLSAALAGEGDCLVNLGSVQLPEMQIVPCDSTADSEVYLVLARFDERVDGESCSPSEPASPACDQEREAAARDVCDGTDYTDYYYELSSEDSQAPSFVLCMEAQFEDPDGEGDSA